jgi:hypothetical protein
MSLDKRSNKGEEDPVGHVRHLRLIMGLGLALVVIAVLIVSVNPGAEGKRDALLSQGLISDEAGLQIDSQELASRVVEKKFQIHMEERDQQMGDIPYVEIWVLNDPFYPLLGEVADLRNDTNTISNKQWQMLGFPDYEPPEEEAPTNGTQSTTQATGATAVSTGTLQRVLMVEEIYEIRGIRYTTIKVNDQAYEKLKAGSEFAEIFRVQEIRDNQTVLVLCGDETYELKVNQLRKI